MARSLSDRFYEFAESECKETSPLYHALSRCIARDDAILDVAQHAALGQPVPNLLFASVQYLLWTRPQHPLAAFYATCTAFPSDPEKAYPDFRDFVLDHSEQIVSLLKSRLVQTNEVRRSAYLFPAFLFALRHFDSRPLALVEIGTSAGLNLLWDKYRYSYGDSVIYGDLSSEVHLTSSFRGTHSPPTPLLTKPSPEISHRIGLDLNVVDATVPDQALWLRALIWPEHHERRRLLDAALRKRSQVPLDLRLGDGFSMLAEIADEVPQESLLCVYHTHVANQISQESRQNFLESIEHIGKKRDVIHIFNNIKPNLHLTAYNQGKPVDVPLANTEGHARWIEWLPRT